MSASLRAPGTTNRGSWGSTSWNAAAAFWMGIAVAVVLVVPLALLIAWLKTP